MRCLLCLAVGLMLGVPGFAQSLGEVTFPNSGAPEAQERFMRGLLLLHSFEYDDSRVAFQEARQIDPDFAMAYWGEALTHNRPIWQQQDRDAALVVLAEMPEEARTKVSERERAYLATLDVLYGEADKEDRDDAYAVAMGELAAAYPDDLNASTFHALAILGTAHEGRDFEIYDRAGQIALAAFAQNPRHPGAAHYVIHSYDDPLNAEKALEAARAYSEIAPDAPHALHMPSHIYFALGMWDEVAELNRRSFEAARSRDAAAGQPLGGHGWHPLYWLHYAELQRGRFEEARRLFDEARELVESGPTRRGWSSIIAMRANHVIETVDWRGEIASLELPVDEVTAGTAQRDAFVRGLTARALHDASVFQSAVQDVQNFLEGGEELGPAEQSIALMLEGLFLVDQGGVAEGLELLREATLLEDQIPTDFGPPNPVKPAHELLGEWLILQSRAGQTPSERLKLATEAQDEFEKALTRAPMRLRSLLGLREASTATGDQAAHAEANAALCRVIRATDNAILAQEMLIGTVHGACESIPK
ncbi:MAG: hypothetical protein IIC18_02625 [Bacteroidetes bacterium]|nr:hypothetical protein [Bacteroidota bacterium]